MERPFVTDVTHSTNEARVTLTGLPNRPGVAGRVMNALADAGVNVDMIIQNEPVEADAGAGMSFTVPRADVEVAGSALRALAAELGAVEVQTDAAMGKVSVIGAGLKSHPEIATKTFTELGAAGVNIEMISTSPIEISVVIAEGDVARAVEVLDAAFPGAETAAAAEPGR